MNAQLRDLVARALYPTKSYNLPSVCERYGLEPSEENEAFSSKTQYVMRRLMKLSDEQVFDVAKADIKEFPDDALQAATEQLDQSGHLVSDLTRHHIAEALNPFDLAGKRDLLELLRKHWPEIDHASSQYHIKSVLADDIYRHAVRNDDWENEKVLRQIGFWPGLCTSVRLRRLRRDGPAGSCSGHATGGAR